MKAHYKTKTGRIVVEIQGETPKALFKSIAEVQELFESDDQCGACQSAAIQFRVRSHQDNEYFELFCLDCGAALSFGQKRTGGGLFPKRKDGEGNPIENSGWKKWRPSQSAPTDESRVTSVSERTARTEQNRPV